MHFHTYLSYDAIDIGVGLSHTVTTLFPLFISSPFLGKLNSLVSRMRTIIPAPKVLYKTSTWDRGSNKCPFSPTLAHWMVLIKTTGIPHPSSKGRKGKCKQVSIWATCVDVEVCNEMHIKLQKREKKSLSTLCAGSKALGIIPYPWSKQT